MIIRTPQTVYPHIHIIYFGYPASWWLVVSGYSRLHCWSYVGGGIYLVTFIVFGDVAAIIDSYLLNKWA